jgi:hypothetical protein
VYAADGSGEEQRRRASMKIATALAVDVVHSHFCTKQNNRNRYGRWVIQARLIVGAGQVVVHVEAVEALLDRGTSSAARTGATATPNIY